MHGEQTVGRWRELAEHLITKYNDGYVRDLHGKYPEVGYPEAWLRRVLEGTPRAVQDPAGKRRRGRNSLLRTGESICGRPEKAILQD